MSHYLAVYWPVKCYISIQRISYTVEADMRNKERVVTVEGPAGHRALLVDGEVLNTDEDGNRIFDLAEEMEKSGEYKGREVSVFWIFNTPTVFY